MQVVSDKRIFSEIYIKVLLLTMVGTTADDGRQQFLFAVFFFSILC